MSKISVDPLKENSLMYLYAIKDEIDMSPEYQRSSDIWPMSKMQLLIDSILNGLDIPKIYFHEINKSNAQGKFIRYAVVDGKQRLETIYKFLEDKFPISDDFEDLSGIFGDLRGYKYENFNKLGIKLKSRFDATQLPVWVIRSKDIELIEEMFSRLNEAAPLNAPEKRNAFPGPMPAAIREIQKQKFFQENVPFENRRYKHYDVISKLLLLENSGKIVDTKKVHLDQFIKSYKDASADSIRGVLRQCQEVINAAEGVFVKKDKLLKHITSLPIYYVIIKIYLMRSLSLSQLRNNLDKFDQARKANRDKTQENENQEGINFDWLEFDRLSQTPNDSSSIEFKVNILLSYLGQETIKREIK